MIGTAKQNGLSPMCVFYTEFVLVQIQRDDLLQHEHGCGGLRLEITHASH